MNGYYSRNQVKVIVVAVIVLVSLVALAFIATPAGAGDGLPDGIAEWTRSDGSICSANLVAGGIDCDCPCTGCEPEDLCTGPIQHVSCLETPEPTVSPTGETPVPSETPEPTKVKCNSGRGNGSEGDPDCDPGNSGGHNKGGD